MRFSWSSDKWGYTLRDGDGNAQALLTRNEEGWHAAIIKVGFPSSGPYKSQVKAGEWAVEQMKRIGRMSPDCDAGPVPYVRVGGKPKAAADRPSA